MDDINILVGVTLIGSAAIFRFLDRHHSTLFLRSLSLAWLIEAARVGMLGIAGSISLPFWAFLALDLTYIWVTWLLLLGTASFVGRQLLPRCRILYLGCGSLLIFALRIIGSPLLNGLGLDQSTADWVLTEVIFIALFLPGAGLRIWISTWFFRYWRTSRVDGALIFGIFFLIHGMGSLKVPFQWYFSYFPHWIELGWFIEVFGVSTAAVILVLTQQSKVLRDSEQALRRSENRFTAFMDNVPGIAYIKDPAQRYLYVNRRLERLLELESKDWTGQTIEEILRRSRSFLEPSTRGIQSADPAILLERLTDSQGRESHWMTHTFPLPDRDSDSTLTAGLSVEITALREAERALDESKTQQVRILESISDGVFTLDEDWRFTFANRKAAKLMKAPPQELLGKPVWTVCPHLLSQGFKEAAEGVLTSGLAARFQFNGLHSGPCYLGKIYPNQNGISVYFQDITKEMRRENQLRTVWQAVEQNSVSITITDREGHIEYVNPAFCNSTGYTLQEVVGGLAEVLDPAKTSDASLIEIWNAINEGRKWQGEVLSHRKLGERFWQEVEVSPIQNAEGERSHCVLNAQDITGRIRLQQQANQAQKMEAIGRLTGGIAHDFNNILTGISGFAELAIAQTPASDSRHEDLIEIQNLSERAASLVGKLLAYSRRQQLEVSVIDLNACIGESLRMLRRVIGEEYVLDFTSGEGECLVKADVTQIHQTLMNLVVNARDAMPHGGTISVKTQPTKIGSKTENHNDLKPGSYVELTITDTGTGIDSETLSKIFEPFFTTKERDKGTGLGLSTVQGIVQQHQGYIDVVSSIDQGTTFTIILPRVLSPITPKESQPNPVSRQCLAKQSILLVEDEPVVRRLAERILLAAGYSVFAASSANAALEIFEEKQGRFDLLISDVILPRTIGPNLYQELKNRNPNLRVIYMSGYPYEVFENRVDNQGPFKFLQKPFTQDALLSEIESVFATSSEPGPPTTTRPLS